MVTNICNFNRYYPDLSENIKKIVILLFLIVSFAFNLSAQTVSAAANFSGTWIEEEKYEDRTMAPIPFTCQSFIEDSEQTLVIEDRNETVTIRAESEKFELILHPDGSGETNRCENDLSESGVHSVTFRENKYIERNYRDKLALGATEIEYERTDKFTLSEDGKQLTLERYTKNVGSDLIEAAFLTDQILLYVMGFNRVLIRITLDIYAIGISLLFKYLVFSR